jgi:hypothetical protein
MVTMSNEVGILAYGSLIGDPGPELSPVVTDRIPCRTPFNIEFARSSDSRSGAPTLVPYPSGSPVEATILVVQLSVEEATHRLYRREMHNFSPTKRYVEPAVDATGKVRVRTLTAFHGVSSVLYTDLDANIAAPSAIELARLAIKSVRTAKEEKLGDNGIAYLRDAISHGIRTPLTASYERKLLDLTGGVDLDNALAIAVESRPKRAGEPPGVDSIENKVRLAEDYLAAAKVLDAQRGPEAAIRLLLPAGQLVAHASELLLKATLEANGLFFPFTHDLVELRHLLAGEGHPLSEGLEFVVTNLGPLHAGHVFRYGDAGHGIPTAGQMIRRLEPEITRLRAQLRSQPTA